MKRIREEIHQLKQRADVAALNENHPTARLLGDLVATFYAAIKEDERRLYQCLEEEMDLRTAAYRTGMPYSTLARKVQNGDIPDVGDGRERRMRVADAGCVEGYLPRLLGVESPKEDSTEDSDTRLEKAPFEEELIEHRRKRLRGTVQTDR